VRLRVCFFSASGLQLGLCGPHQSPYRFSLCIVYDPRPDSISLPSLAAATLQFFRALLRHLLDIGIVPSLLEITLLRCPIVRLFYWLSNPFPPRRTFIVSCPSLFLLYPRLSLFAPRFRFERSPRFYMTPDGPPLSQTNIPLQSHFLKAWPLLALPFPYPIL